MYQVSCLQSSKVKAWSRINRRPGDCKISYTPGVYKVSYIFTTRKCIESTGLGRRRRPGRPTTARPGCLLIISTSTCAADSSATPSRPAIAASSLVSMKFLPMSPLASASSLDDTSTPGRRAALRLRRRRVRSRLPRHLPQQVALFVARIKGSLLRILDLAQPLRLDERLLELRLQLRRGDRRGRHSLR